ncbi:MAG TPA: helix-turn-helix domain-containing protein [Fimbriimonadaceae bacterium]|nr:helix-turn-helix domain-containing protein [Fimbriimonadaceae bacterium]
MQDVAVDWASLANKLRTARMQHGLTHRELAKLSGVNRGTLMRMEQGHPCYMSTLEKVASALYLTADALAHPALALTGPFSIQAKSKELIRYRPSAKFGHRLPEYSQDQLRDSAERTRIGGLGLVSCFEWVPDIALPGGKLRATLLELHGETPAAHHNGEELVHAVRGSSQVRLGHDTIVIHEGETATFWPDVTHSYMPAEPVAPGQRPPLLLSVRLDGPRRHGRYGKKRRSSAEETPTARVE